MADRHEQNEGFHDIDAALPGGEHAPDLARIEVTLSRAEGPAPLGVTFQLRSDDPNFRSFLLFGSAEWTFSTTDAENYRFAHLDGDLAGERAGRAGGPYVGHVYVTPGIHRWQVTLHYPGMAPRTITATARTVQTGLPVGPVRVIDPDTYFDRRTIYFSNAYPTAQAFRAAAASLGIAGNLPGDRYVVGDEAFREALRRAARQPGLPWRFLLQAGRTYRLSRRTVNNDIRNCFVDRFGVGHDPIITLATDGDGRSDVADGFFFNVDDKEGFGPCGLANLDIRGLYDSTNPGYIEPWIGIAGLRVNNAGNFGVQVFRCRLTGLGTAINCTHRAVGTIIADCRLTGWFDFGIWHNDQDDSAIVGCDIKQRLGTVNTGRKSTAVANTGDRASHFDPAPLLAKFDWSLEWNASADPPRQGPRPRGNAPPIPPGEAAPRSGGWDRVSAWWKAHWRAFDWAQDNRRALGVHDNGQWRNAAIHGPYRSGHPGTRFGLHQCELRSLNGWSRSGRYRDDLPATAQDANAFAIQPCLRMATAVDNRFVGYSASVHRVAFEGGVPTVAILPQTRSVSTQDTDSLPLAVVMSDCIIRADTQTTLVVGMAYGATALRNSLIHVPPAGEEGAGSIIPFDRHHDDVAAGSAPIHVFNTTVVIEGRSSTARLWLPRDNPSKRPVIVRNLLLLNHGGFSNDDAFVDPAAYTDLVAGPIERIGVPYRPGARSNIRGGSDALVPHRDLAGSVRPDPAALGAFESE